jgi:hypothetical protein
MTDKEDWGPWQVHDGKGCPVPLGTIIQMEAVSASGAKERLIVVVRNSAMRLWVNPNVHGFSIIRYRIRKPRALMDLIELVENLPAPVGPKVDA